VKTLCPTCKTRYEIDPRALLEADGLARCFRCGTVFDAVAEDAPTPGNVYSTPVENAVALGGRDEIPRDQGRDADSEPAGEGTEVDRPARAQGPGPAEHAPPDTVYRALSGLADRPAPQAGPIGRDISPVAEPVAEPVAAGTVSDTQDESGSASTAADDQQPQTDQPAQDRADQADSTDQPLPFSVPEDLVPLEPSPDVALDVNDALYEKKSRRGLVYGLVIVMLLTGLGLQLAWQHRKDLVDRYPGLAPLCESLACLPKVIHAPDKISVLQRDIKPAANEPGSLTLSASIRNDAEIAQQLPDIQLSLLDNNGAVLIRRRLAPSDYLFPAPAKERVMEPGEVVTITLDFEDPGHQASGFVIDFL